MNTAFLCFTVIYWYYCVKAVVCLKAFNDDENVAFITNTLHLKIYSNRKQLF